MPDAAEVLTAFRRELEAAELIRAPSTDPDTLDENLPPMHVEPADGIPAPGEREGIEDHPTLVTAILNAGIAGEEGPTAAQRRRVAIDVRFRAKDNAALRVAMALEAAITARLLRPETNYGFGFDMGGMFVHAVSAGGGGPLGSGRATGFDRVAKYLIEVAA